MSLRKDTIQTLRARRQRLLDGGINTIPSPFARFSNDFLGWEQATYYLFTSYTKGKLFINLSISFNYWNLYLEENTNIIGNI